MNPVSLLPHLVFSLLERTNTATSAADRKLTMDYQCLKVSRFSDKLQTQNLSTFWTVRKYRTQYPQDHPQDVRSEHTRQVYLENPAKY